MPSALPPLRVVAAKLDVTYEAENVTFSNADPGGYEIATFDLASDKADLLTPGDRVRILDGLHTVWEGRIAEPAKAIKRGWRTQRKVGANSTRVSCEGNGAQTKDNFMSMVYIDRDLSRWQTWSVSRQIVQAGSPNNLNTQQFSWVAGADTTGIQPGIIITGQGQLINKPTTEVWYDAGPQNLVGRIRVGAITSQGYTLPDANSFLTASVCNDDKATTSQQSPNAGGAQSQTIDFIPATPYRYAFIQHLYNVTAASGIAGIIYGFSVRNVSVLGNHGLPLRGTSPNDGFYPSDIARDAAQRAALFSKNLKIGRIDSLSGYIVIHEVEYMPVNHEKIISDMAKLAPAHYGVWESSSIFDDIPEFVFTAYLNKANIFTSLADCDEIDISERLANLYTSANITFQDAAGTPFAITVTLPNSVLAITGGQRTAQLDIGLSSTAAAQTFATFALQIMFDQARAAGSIQLPRKVRDANGALVPAYRLKSGIDRIRIADLPTRGGAFSSADTDSFRISRVESNVDSTSGEIRTRIEVDGGVNLMDTLTSRLQVATKLSGLGF